ncbi:helix-turn-helix domain-containing protein [Candidatus Neomicrothrix sp.]|uniref:helix-turn-helix domain-containing protein n=1 Tax=Candidatus Neomicrothrix sp. TaxID=2719034 RepID=UPI003CD0CE9F
MLCRADAVIREARRRSGLSQAELARRAHVSQPVISAYESGRREPGLSMLTRLVEASGHSVSLDLVSDPDRPRGLPDTPTGRKLRRRRRAIIEAADDAERRTSACSAASPEAPTPSRAMSTFLLTSHRLSASSA